MPESVKALLSAGTKRVEPAGMGKDSEAVWIRPSPLRTSKHEKSLRLRCTGGMG